jgi:multiple sugar transport system permease protein
MRETVSSKVFRWVVVVFLTLFTAVPLYVMITSSVKPLADVQGAFTWWPTNITFQPFIDMWSTVPLASYFINSVIVASAATILSLIIAVFAAYAVSRYRFKGRGVFTTTVLSTQMFPGVLFLLPLFLIFVNINQAVGIQLVGTRWGLVITYLTFALPFAI